MLWGVIGNTGLLGSDLEVALKASGQQVVGFNRSNLNLELSVEELAEQIASKGRFDVLVNSIAYTDVDKAELEPNQAHMVNATYASKLALVAKKLGSRFVHLSTDYVFDGTNAFPYLPTDKPNPQSAYGHSKLAGEIAVEESGAEYQIFRTAWLYGKNGTCFPKTVQKVLSESGQMKVVNNQIGQPTWTKDLADLIIAHSKLEASARPNIVHATASGEASWFDFAREVAKSLGHDADEVILPIQTLEYPTPAKRPANSVLNNQNNTGLGIGDWKTRWQVADTEVLGLPV